MGVFVQQGSGFSKSNTQREMSTQQDNRSYEHSWEDDECEKTEGADVKIKALNMSVNSLSAN